MIPDDPDPVEEYLKENGPTREADLPFEVTKRDQTKRARRFISPFGEASHPRDTDTEDAVWYDTDTTRAGGVIHAYLDANEKLQTAPTEHVIERIRTIEPTFVAAAFSVIEEYDGIRPLADILDEQNTSRGRTSRDQDPCPMCDEPLDGVALAFHLTGCPKWGGSS